VLEPRPDSRFYRHCLDRLELLVEPEEIDFADKTVVDFKPGQDPDQQVWGRLAEFLANPRPLKLLFFHDPRPLITTDRESVDAFYLDPILEMEWQGLIFIDYFNYSLRHPRHCMQDLSGLLDRRELGGLQYCHGRNYQKTHELHVLAAPRLKTLDTVTAQGQQRLFRMG